MTTRAEAIKARMRALEAELATIQLYGDDEFEPGTVIRWKKRFAGGQQKYTYAALKAGGMWYLTGVRSDRSVTWDELVLLIQQPGVKKVQVASGWKSMSPAPTGGVRVMMLGLPNPESQAYQEVVGHGFSGLDQAEEAGLDAAAMRDEL